MDPVAVNVIRRAGYLNVGDVILYGKWKNARARILSFGVNEKGDPTIEAQPINKDGTDKKGKPKTLTLLKVRKVQAASTAYKVAARYIRAMNDEKMGELLSRLRKKAWGSVKTVKKLKDVLDYLGGWSLEPFVGLVRYPGFKDDAKAAYFGAQADVESMWGEAKRNEVKSLPTNPKPDRYYTMRVDDVGTRGTRFRFRFILHIGAWGWRITSPGGKVFELLPDYRAFERTNRWTNEMHVDIRSPQPLGKRTSKFIRLQPALEWLMTDTRLEEQINQLLGTDEHTPSPERTRMNTGSCPVCFRNIKLKRQSGQELPVMVNHGFQRPGWGHIVGNCIGVGFSPYELSPEGTKHLLKDVLYPELEKISSEIGHLERRPAKLRLEGGGVVTQDDPWYQKELDQAIQRTILRSKSVQTDVDELESMLEGWREQPLPEEGQEVLVWR